MEPAIAPLPSGAGATGFDSTGATRKKKMARRKSGAVRPAAPPPLPGPPLPAAGHANAPQIAARAPYAEAYRPPDAPLRRPRVPIEDAYEPLGLQVGSFMLRPSFEIARGFDSNPARVTGGHGSYYTAVEPALQLRSQWARHAFGADLRGSLLNYDTLSSSNRPQAEARAFTRFDVTRDTRVDFEGRFALSTDNPGSPNLQPDIAKLPIYYSYGSTAGLTQRFNRFEFSVKGNIDRTQYRTPGWSTARPRAITIAISINTAAQVRASYELTPGIKPFVELGADTRQHDLEFDRNGFQRDSSGLTPKAGTTFELTRKLTGEVSVGYLTRRYQDQRCPT